MNLKCFYRGYIITDDKKSTMKFKNKDVLTYDQVKDLPEYAGVLNDDTVLIDIDDKYGTIRGRKLSDVLLDIIEDLQLNCRVHESRGGIHLLFKNSDVHKKCIINKTLACGIPSDIKVGTSSYEVLKIDNKERFVLWDKDPQADYQTCPKWLSYVSNNDFIALGEGDGRNQKLFNYILTLQANGFTKEEARECIRIINKYILPTPLSDSELETILRDDAFSKPVFFDKTTFLFDKFAHYLQSEKHIYKVNGGLHIYKDGYYQYGYEEIQRAMINLIPNLKDTQRKEVLKYLELIAPVKEVASANYIAFNNGIYNIITDTLEPYTPEIVITNKIPHDYNPGAYSELADKTLNKIACEDSQVRALFEEYIGYNFYRRNELGKAFIFTGDKANGKSTFLNVMNHILGYENTSALDIAELRDRFNTAMLCGKLANIGDDIGDEFLSGNAVAIFKKLVTGDRVKAERKGLDPFEFNPYTKFTFSANEIPKMRDKTGAVIRRLVIIPCDATFTKDDPDYRPFIKYELLEEECLEYFIKIGIEGLKRVLSNNQFTESSKCIEQLKDYEIENDNFLQFISDITVDDVENKTSQEVYLRYTSSLTGSQSPVTKYAFSKRICKVFGLKTTQKKIDGKVYRIFVR
jgi:putative DNA primase/helicase